GVDHKRVVTG
ncbi:unnamed protein product, partial [Coregonus sp. 'balchen']